MDKLGDWPAVLLDFKKMLPKSNNIPTPPSGDASAPLRLFRMIIQNNSTRNYSAVEANFLYAAVHIAFMNELTFSNDACLLDVIR